MRGVVAAGSAVTAEAAVEILRAGGNAVDAAVAAALAGFCAEPLLTSPGGAGVMLVRRAGVLSAIDFFSPFPGAGGRPAKPDFHAVEVNFGPARQVFHIGRASAAVPMSLDGLAVAAREFGTMGLGDLASFAIGLAEGGTEVDATAALTFELLWPILSRDPGCMAELAVDLPSDRPPRLGERMRNPALGQTLREWAVAGLMPPRLREGLLQAFGPAAGGLISSEDLDAARVVVGAPHIFELGSWTVASSPRLGGHLVGLIATELGGSRDADEGAEVLRQARASLAGHRARLALPPPNLHGSTTHISIVDANLDAAAVTLTAGEGCGHVVPGTGVHLNNFLGEEDLNPTGFHMYQPGDALPTMVAPTLAVDPEGQVLALGSGGSNRIRSAVALVLDRIVRRGMSLDAAVHAPRVHAEEGEVWVELADRGSASGVEASLATGFDAVRCFEARDFFFGGVHVSGRLDGQLVAAADSRRHGACRLV